MDRGTEGEGWVEALLRKRPIQSVEDDGFARRLTMALPRRPDPLRWVAPAAALAGLIAGGALSGGWILRTIGDLAARIPAPVLASPFGASVGVWMLAIVAVASLAATWAAGVWALGVAGRRS